jgi:hypothetical protein
MMADWAFIGIEIKGGVKLLLPYSFFMPVFSKSFFPFVSCHFMAFSFFTAGHEINILLQND